jgi:Rod binding domain-containing protein
MVEILNIAANKPTLPDRHEALRKVANDLEASFLAEMLKSAGLGKSSGHFGGGAGEDQFGSFLVQEQAKLMVRAGGIGLSEALFETLKEKNDAKE